MCLILFAYKKHPKYPLIVAANRDEFYERPTAAAHFWEDIPQILAGRDLEKMGTWMGLTTKGRFSALTNYRNPKESQDGKKSRGQLVTDSLMYEGSIKNYMESLSQSNRLFPGYNLLAGDIHHLYYYSNVGGKAMELDSGIYGLSNHLLNSSWPKVEKGREGLKRIIERKDEPALDELFSLLADSEQAPDERLPKTGVPLEMERMLSPLFIESEGYGTRSSTVLLLSETEGKYVERVYGKDGTHQTQTFTIAIDTLENL